MFERQRARQNARPFRWPCPIRLVVVHWSGRWLSKRSRTRGRSGLYKMHAVLTGIALLLSWSTSSVPVVSNSSGGISSISDPRTSLAERGAATQWGIIPHGKKTGTDSGCLQFPGNRTPSELMCRILSDLRQTSITAGGSDTRIGGVLCTNVTQLG